MKTLNFSIDNLNAIDSYLYAGNLYVFFENGRIAYISFTHIVRILQEQYPSYRNLFELAFLHNDYINTAAGRLFLGVNGVRDVILREWKKAQKEICFSILFQDIEKYFHNIGEWNSIPLDIRLYAMRLFFGCEDGLYESIISQDDKAKVSSGKINKVFDSRVVSVNAKYGVIAISADEEGLFSSSLIDDKHIKVKDNPDVNRTSLRTDWKETDILNYDASSRFQYIHNQYERTNKQTPNYHTLRKSGEFKRIDKFAIQIDDMDPLLNELQIERNDLNYCFNSGSSAFLKLKDGTFFATDFKQRTGGTYKKIIKESKGCNKIMSYAVVPSGCVLRYYDRTILYKDNEAFLLCGSPSYGVRSYTNSNQYRSLLSINTEESILIHSTESFNPLLTPQEDMGKYGRVRYSNIFRLNKHINNDFDELPF